MTPGNWPYRADEFLPNQKASVPPIDSCACDTKAYDSNAGNILASIQYPPKYQTLKETNAVDSADASTQEIIHAVVGLDQLLIILIPNQIKNSLKK